ncbi:MAG: 50S ribosomal protein P1 [Candidatus Hydrothermarchaeota archaeon]
MEYVYAAMLLHAAKKEINEENVTKVLSAPGVQVNEARVKALIAALEGVNIDEALKQAMVPVAAPAPAAAPAEAKKGEKKEAKTEEKKEETEAEALAGLGALFG